MIPFPDKKYNVIVVDPPWQLKKLTHKARPNQVGFDYPTMSCEEISTLPIQDITGNNCWCFLWTTQKYLTNAMEIIKDWEFNHLFTMVWEKTYGRSSGMPLYGFRWNAEFIVVGVNFKPQIWQKGKPLIPMVFQAPNIGHSIKPQKFYDLINGLGNTRLDMFAREHKEGWDAWGDEVC